MTVGRYMCLHYHLPFVYIAMFIQNLFVSSRDKQVKTRIIQYVYSVKQVNTVNILFNSQPWHSSQRHGGITVGREEVRYEIAYRYTLGSRVHYKMTSYIIPWGQILAATPAPGMDPTVLHYHC